MDDREMLEITFFGNSSFEISSSETTILVDPYISGNDECPYGIDEIINRAAGYDAIAVTHLAQDHMGDCLLLATETDTPVMTEPATAYYLGENGVPEENLTSIVWGQTATIGNLDVRGLESHHISGKELDDGYLTGLPLAFLISDEEKTLIHTGDTSIFSDLQLFGELYQPDAALIGIGQAYPHEGTNIEKNIAELTIREAVLVAEWLDSDTVVPMHYLPSERAEFVARMNEAEHQTNVRPLRPGESLQI